VGENGRERAECNQHSAVPGSHDEDDAMQVDSALYQNGRLKAKASPAFQFYPGDFVGGTGRMTTTEVGGYILLLCEQWTQGGIPGDEPRALAAIMRCTPATAKSIWKVVASKFSKNEEDGQWRNVRLEVVRKEQAEFRELQSAKGQASAKARGNRAPNRKATGPRTEVQPSTQPDAEPDVNSSIFDLQSSLIDQSKEHSDLAKPHPIRDLLTFHETTFVARYGTKPAPYTGKDAKHAADLLKAHGDIRARRLVEAFFASSDPFVAKSGHGLGMLMAVQNKIIAEMSGTTPKGDGLDGLREFARG
jgi:uncharacterized protein YdaU (DUF1376 family)